MAHQLAADSQIVRQTCWAPLATVNVGKKQRLRPRDRGPPASLQSCLQCVVVPVDPLQQLDHHLHLRPSTHANPPCRIADGTLATRARNLQLCRNYPSGWLEDAAG